MNFSFTVSAWAAWTPGAEGLETGGAVRTEALVLPAALRRRTTGIGRKALAAALAILPEAGAPRFVLASRHGEYRRTFAMLQALSEEGAVSPTDFSMAVHHALAGLLSIATGNHEGHTAIAAGPDSFAYGLMEAGMWVAEAQIPALMIYFDEALPAAYPSEGEPPEMVLAVGITPAVAGSGLRVTMMGEAAQGEGRSLALAFLETLRRGRGDGGAQGGRMAWRWQLDA
ncbi:conserved hypothetical protein [Candidatus Terasakiella magnetica]|nr:conserved hypothetical protein [Candidatus Terasakiella magnetica]